MLIEMSFGRLMNKFRILKAPLHCSIENAPRLFLLAATHLHNYCINEVDAVKEPDPNDPPPLPSAYYNQGHANSFRGQSIMRELLVQKIAQKGLL